METLLYSILEFLAQPEIIIFFLALIFLCFMFRITGAEKLWNEQRKEAKQDELEKQKIKLAITNTERKIYEEEQKLQEAKKPSVVYIKEERANDNSMIIMLLCVLLLISIFFNYQQYQELQQYRTIFGELKETISIFQQFLK